MDKMLKQARRESGEAKFERTCTRKTMGLRRMQLARNVPGTQEAGRAAMYNAETNRILARLRAAK